MPTNRTNFHESGEKILFAKESYEIVGACLKVYNEMGCGFLEAVYQECLAIEFAASGIEFEQQKKITIAYRDSILAQEYRADFICFGKILIEIKAVSRLADEHRAQVLNYLHATGFKLAILLNFGNHQKLEYERLVL